MMVPAFEAEVFRMKPGEISGPVESDFGFHVIRLAAVKPGKLRPLEEVRGEIERELKKQRAGRKFAEAAEQFSNMVYEQPDSLKPVAEKFKLKVQDAGWVTRAQAKEPLNNPRLLTALFSDDAVKNRRNTEAVEVAPGTLVAARVAEHKPAAVRPFEEVRAEAQRQLALKEATALAWKEGPEKVELLKKGGTPAVPFSAPQLVGRGGAQGFPPEALAAAFRVKPEKLPAYAGVQMPDGYAIVRVSKIVPAALDEAKEKGMQAELGRTQGGSQLQAYIAALRADTKVQVNQAALQKKE
jgi:peptidyl-prolyl cis-trans isomerase D